MFYSASVRPGKPAVFVPPPEEVMSIMLHLSQACLPHDAPEGTRASLLVRFEEDEEPAVLCTLCAGRLDTVALDQFVTHYAEFTVAGNATIHLSGYFSPQYGALDGPDEGEDDGDYMHGMHPMLMDEDSDEGEEDSEDDEGEDESDDDGAGFGWPAAGRREPSAVIEEIEDDRAGKGAAAKKAAAEDSEEEEDEDEEDDEGESEDDEGEESEEEAPKQKQPQQQQKQPQQPQKQPQDQPKQQQKQQQTPQAGDKRKAAQAAAEPASKKPATAAPASTAGKTPAKGAAQQQAAAKTPQAGKQQEQQQQTPASAAAKRAKPRVFENGFEIHDLKMGQPDGRVARPGKRVLMRYVGRLKKNGKVFDQNLKGKPFAFRLGVGEVIKGWDRGVDGMRVGDKRKLVIPPAMAYGTQSLPGIPPNSTLEFEVELVDVKG